MPEALARLKTPPLLSPPDSGASDYVVPEGDRECILGRFREARRHSDGGELAWMHDYMRKVGMPQRITREDNKKMLERLKSVRRGSVDGYDLSNILVHMAELGRGQVLEDREGSIMVAQLESCRPFGIGMLLALHYNLKLLGIGVDVTERDREVIRKETRSLRKKGMDTNTVLHNYYYMDKLGFPEKIGPEDEVQIGENLALSRRDNDGRTLLKTHYYISELLPGKPKEAANPLPPLKRFRGAG